MEVRGSTVLFARIVSWKLLQIMLWRCRTNRRSSLCTLSSLESLSMQFYFIFVGVQWWLLFWKGPFIIFWGVLAQMGCVRMQVFICCWFASPMPPTQVTSFFDVAALLSNTAAWLLPMQMRGSSILLVNIVSWMSFRIVLWEYLINFRSSVCSLSPLATQSMEFYLSQWVSNHEC